MRHPTIEHRLNMTWFSIVMPKVAMRFDQVTPASGVLPDPWQQRTKTWKTFNNPKWVGWDMRVVASAQTLSPFLCLRSGGRPVGRSVGCGRPRRSVGRSGCVALRNALRAALRFFFLALSSLCWSRLGASLVGHRGGFPEMVRPGWPSSAKMLVPFSSFSSFYF